VLVVPFVRKFACLLAVVFPILAFTGVASASNDGYRDLAEMGLTPPPVDSATSKSLYASSTLNAIANDIVGASDMVVAIEDDPVEWTSFFGPDAPNILGVVVFQPSPSPLYHAIFISPLLYPVVGSWLSTGSPVGNEYPFAVAAMTLIHESLHWKLLSGDESMVNACALKYFPSYLERDFRVPSTISQTATQTVAVKTTTRVKTIKTKVTRTRVKVKGKWVIRIKRIPVTTYTTKTTTTYVDQPVTTTVPNPLFQTLVANAGAFYSQQPPPYNSGTCLV
jgi:hypothetical protein